MGSTSKGILSLGLRMGSVVLWRVMVLSVQGSKERKLARGRAACWVSEAGSTRGRAGDEGAKPEGVVGIGLDEAVADERVR